MKHLFVPYELAVIAKEKGFNEECFKYFLDQNIVKGGMSNNLYSAHTNNNGGG